MRYYPILLVGACLVAGAALAQAPAEPGADLTLSPVAVRAPDYRAVTPPLPGAAGRSPFRFSDGRDGSVLNIPPPQSTDRDVVLGTSRPWMGGQPPLDCAMTPRDARCH